MSNTKIEHIHFTLSADLRKELKQLAAKRVCSETIALRQLIREEYARREAEAKERAA